MTFFGGLSGPLKTDMQNVHAQFRLLVQAADILSTPTLFLFLSENSKTVNNKTGGSSGVLFSHQVT